MTDDETIPPTDETGATEPAPVLEKLTARAGAGKKPARAGAGKKPARAGAGKLTARAGAGKKADDGMSADAGNRDDAAELDMGARDPAMGAPPMAGDVDAPETQEERIARLERELVEARAGLDALVPEEARRAMGLGGATRAMGAADPAALPGTGPVVWDGHIDRNALFHFGPGRAFRFRSTASEAEAREAYMGLNGIRATTGTVVVARVEG